MIRQRYSNDKIQDEIKVLRPNYVMTTITDDKPLLMNAYAKILMTYPSRIPDNINPDPEMVRLKGIFYHMGIVEIKKCFTSLFGKKYG